MFQSKSCTPWEHNTIDYLSPESSDLTITYDTDGDTLSPTEEDTPLIELIITDEGDINAATITYSDDGGSTWNYASLEERENDDDHWYGYIPGHEHGTTISWYIYTLDESLNSKIIKNSDGDNFEYTVISRPPTVELLSPNRGGTFNNSILIEWTGSDPDDDSLTYTIGYQIDGGGWNLLASGLTNNSFVWDIGAIADSLAVALIVYADDGFCAIVSDESDFVFEIDNVDIPTIQMNLINPNGGEILASNCTISWTVDLSDELIDYQVKLEYSIDSHNWTTIVTGVTGTSYHWDISALPVGTNYRIRITLTASYFGADLATIVDVSENAFTILESTDSIGLPLISLFGLLAIIVIPAMTLTKRKQK